MFFVSKLLKNVDGLGYAWRVSLMTDAEGGKVTKRTLTFDIPRAWYVELH